MVGDRARRSLEEGVWPEDVACARPEWQFGACSSVSSHLHEVYCIQDKLQLRRRADGFLFPIGASSCSLRTKDDHVRAERFRPRPYTCS